MDIKRKITEVKKFLREQAPACDQEILHYLEELCQLCEELYAQASIDFLTGLYNRRFFEKELELSVERAKRDRLIFSLILLDLDHFKKINDRYGHLAGDQVLKGVGSLIKKSIRKIDIPARYGGEEFAIILPGTGFEGALSVARRLKEKISEADFDAQPQPIKVTASMGVGTYRPLNGLSPQEFFKQIDALLYQAKQAGRNQIFPRQPQQVFGDELEGITYDEKQALKGVWLHDD